MGGGVSLREWGGSITLGGLNLPEEREGWAYNEAVGADSKRIEGRFISGQECCV